MTNGNNKFKFQLKTKWYILQQLTMPEEITQHI